MSSDITMFSPNSTHVYMPQVQGQPAASEWVPPGGLGLGSTEQLAAKGWTDTNHQFGGSCPPLFRTSTIQWPGVLLEGLLCCSSLTIWRNWLAKHNTINIDTAQVAIFNSQDLTTTGRKTQAGKLKLEGIVRPLLQKYWQTATLKQYVSAWKQCPTKTMCSCTRQIVQIITHEQH